MSNFSDEEARHLDESAGNKRLKPLYFAYWDIARGARIPAGDAEALKPFIEALLVKKEFHLHNPSNAGRVILNPETKAMLAGGGAAGAETGELHKAAHYGRALELYLISSSEVHAVGSGDTTSLAFLICRNRIPLQAALAALLKPPPRPPAAAAAPAPPLSPRPPPAASAAASTLVVPRQQLHLPSP